MISVSNLSVHFGGTYLFNDISFLINKTDRIGLVGKNGAGKSTLLKILAGIQQAETGSISKPSNAKFGYLPQDGITSKGKTVLDETATAFDEINRLEEEMHEISEQLSTRTDYESEAYHDLLERLHVISDQFNYKGGTTMQGEMERILKGLGFTETDFTRLTDEFSGGWQMRIELAKILLRQPDIILLDEPTNHLDIESVRWLENFLAQYSGAVILVSHDKAFLDAITNRTIEITLGEIEDYNCSYSKYLEQRAERKRLQQAAFENQQRYIAQQERFIERFKAKANFASRTQSRVKMLDKLERIEIDEEDTSAIRFRFPPAPRSGLSVAEARNFTKAYGEKVILRDIEFSIGRGEKIAFVGKNGQGKTTLAKIFAGVDTEFQGIFQHGANVNVGYYAQHQAEMLDGTASVFEIIDRAAQGDIRTQIRALLGAFLFSGDAIEKKVRTLSGGEKSRLALCKLMLEPVNFLILDEPTNHLDIRSKEVLKQALMDFDGAMVVVSHDRDFLQGLTEKVVEFRDGKLREHIGDVYEFLRVRDVENLRELERTDKPAPQKQAEIKSTSAATNAEQAKQQQAAQNRELKKQLERDLRTVKKGIEENEKNVAALEQEKLEIERKMADVNFYKDSANAAKTSARLSEVERILTLALAEWERLNERLEQINKEIGQL